MYCYRVCPNMIRLQLSCKTHMCCHMQVQCDDRGDLLLKVMLALQDLSLTVRSPPHLRASLAASHCLVSASVTPVPIEMCRPIATLNTLELPHALRKPTPGEMSHRCQHVPIVFVMRPSDRSDTHNTLQYFLHKGFLV